MVFTSFIYYLFFPTVFGLYWFVFQRNFKAQNVLLLVASYFFYGWWDWRFLSLVAFSTVLDYTMGRLIGAQEDDRKRRWLLWISLGINLAFLGFFKYYNFFVTSWVDAWASVGIHMPDAQYHFALGNQLLHVSEHELFIGRVQGAYAAAQGLFELCHLCQLFPAVGCRADRKGCSFLAAGDATTQV